VSDTSPRDLHRESNDSQKRKTQSPAADTFDHVGDSFTRQIQKWLDIQIVRCLGGWMGSEIADNQAVNRLIPSMRKKGAGKISRSKRHEEP